MAQVLADLDQAREFLRFFERDAYLFGGERLDDIIKRAVPHAIHRGFDRTEPGHNDGQRLLRTRLQFPEQIGPLAVRQAHIQKNQIERVPGEQFLGGGDGARRGDLVAPLPQLLLEVLANDEVILKDDDFFDWHLNGLLAPGHVESSIFPARISN